MSRWIQTYTGLKFDLLRPRPEQVRIEDVAHSLAGLPRFTRHTPETYSVAQHSCHVHDVLAGTGHEACGLMHDAPEAYVNDVAAPMKRAMRDLIKELFPHLGGETIPLWAAQGRSPHDEIERRVWADAVAVRFDLPRDMPPEVKEADVRMLATEKALLGKEPQDWDLPLPPYDAPIDAWDLWGDERAEDEFLRRYYALKARGAIA